jgi:inorganic pyrophosphatase
MPIRTSRMLRKLANVHSPAVIEFRPHPWHGLEVGPEPPQILNACIEITPFDLVKYEVDKVSGISAWIGPNAPRHSTRPCTASSRARTATNVSGSLPRGRNGDPLDICLLSERAITRNEIIVPCRVIGGLQMIDRGEADDKIVGVLEDDYVWGAARDVSDVPSVLVERLQHYFLTYKLVPGRRAQVRVAGVYGRHHALQVVRAAMADYEAAFPARAASAARQPHPADQDFRA